MKVTFWLLDLNYESNNDVPEIWIWGVTDSGERVLIIDDHPIAYFYAVLEENTDPSKVVEEINKCHLKCVSDLEIVDRKFFGKPVKAVKVCVKTPNVMPEYAKTLRKRKRLSRRRHSIRHAISNRQQRRPVSMARGRSDRSFRQEKCTP